MAFRFLFLTAVFGLLYGLLGFNLYYLQVSKGEEYVVRVRARGEFETKLALRRGQIFFTDKNNNPVSVALNRDYPVIVASPEDVKNPSSVADAIASIIGWEKEDLEKALDNPESRFRLLV